MVTEALLTTLELAVDVFQQGDYPQAKQLYQQVLQQDPHHPDALHLLGLLEATQGDTRTATVLIQQAIALQPEPLYYRNLAHLLKQNQQDNDALSIYQQWREQHPEDDEAWYHLALLAHQLGQFATAADAWQHLLRHHPNSPETYNNLGNVHLDQGFLEEARTMYQQAVHLNPNFAIGWYNLGRVCQQQGDFEGAWNCYQKALHLAPDFADVYNILGIWYQHQHQPEQALEAYKHALRLNPELAEAYNNLGALLYEQKEVTQAVGYYRQALQRMPHYAAAWQNLGTALKEQGQVHEALQAYERALAISPDQALEIRRAMLLPPIYESQTAVFTWRQRYQDTLYHLQQRHLRVDDPVADINDTKVVLPYQGLGDRELQQQLAQICLQACPDLGFTAPYVGKRHAGPIRLGFVSHHLRNHTIGKLMRGLIYQLSLRPEFEVIVFFAGPTQDALSQWIREHLSRTIELPYHWQTARTHIMAAQPDILFYPDLGMEPLTYFLAFSRLATLQCTTWGHPLTSGIPAIDTFFSSQELETDGSITQYSEKLRQLHHLIPYYDCPIRPEKSAARTDYGLPEKAHLYVCAQSLFKFHPDFDALLGQILRQDPHGRIVLLSGHQPQWQTLLQQRWQTTLPDVCERLVFVPRQNEAGYLNLLTLADVILDPIHFGGGNTSYEAFAMGVPVVTFPSPYLKGRLTYAMCRQMEWLTGVAASPENYVALALRLAQDFDFNQSQRQELAVCRHRLYQDETTVNEVTNALCELWAQAVG